MAGIQRFGPGAIHHERHEVEAAALPRTRDIDPFPWVFAHYPTAWMFSPEHGFLPKLSKVSGKPGVNGVRERPNGSDIGPAVGAHMQRGASIIRTSDARLGEFRNYLAVFPVEGGGKHYAERWVRYVQVGRRLQVDSKATEAAHIEFLQAVRDSGVIEPIDPVVYESMRERAEERVRRAERRATPIPERIEEAKGYLAALDAAWAEYAEDAIESAPAVSVGEVVDMDDAIPTPKRRTRRAKKDTTDGE